MALPVVGGLPLSVVASNSTLPLVLSLESGVKVGAPSTRTTQEPIRTSQSSSRWACITAKLEATAVMAIRRLPPLSAPMKILPSSVGSVADSA